MIEKTVSIDAEIKLLRHLINQNKDMSVFFEQAKLEIGRPEIASGLGVFEFIHLNAISRFQRELDMIGVDPEHQIPHETLKGRINILLGDIISRFSYNTDKTLIGFLEEAENECLKTLKNALDNRSLSLRMHCVLEEEYAELKKAEEHLEKLRSLAA